MSFEDYQTVDVDFYDREFTITRNNGKVHTYAIDAEKTLLKTILQHSGEVEINTIGYANRNRAGQFIKGSTPWNKGMKMKR